MINLSVSQYVAGLNALTIGDLIVYYFTAYIFLVLMQRILGFEFESQINPKVLASLILIQFFYFIRSNIGGLNLPNDIYGSYVVTAMLMLICIFPLQWVFSLGPTVSLPSLAMKRSRRTGMVKFNEKRVSSVRMLNTLVLDSYICIIVLYAAFKSTSILGYSLVGVCLIFMLPKTRYFLKFIGFIEKDPDEVY